MSKENWRPAWDRECRQPAWATGQASRNLHNPFGNNKYLWGNTPAFDVLNLDQNEGLDYPEDLALLFAGWFSTICTVYVLTCDSVRRPASCCQDNC
jgi:hypothetical protein